jgi:hypothetical protein
MHIHLREVEFMEALNYETMTLTTICMYAHSQIKTDFNRAIIGGHSRGGQLAFRIMSTNSSGPGYEFLGVIGVDPVDGGRSVCIKPFGLNVAQPRDPFIFSHVYVHFVCGRFLWPKKFLPFLSGPRTFCDTLNARG